MLMGGGVVLTRHYRAQYPKASAHILYPPPQKNNLTVVMADKIVCLLSLMALGFNHRVQKSKEGGF